MKLEQVVDEMEIRRLVDTFCDGLNSRDSELWGTVWADDGASFCLGGDDIVGKENVIAGSRMASPRSSSWCRSRRTAVSISTATQPRAGGTSSNWASYETGRQAKLWLCATTQYVRTSDGWRLQRRSVERIYKGDAAVDGLTRPTAD